MERINIYGLKFKGCRSRFGCKLKTNKEGCCITPDEIHDLLIDIRKSDGFVFASPVNFPERLMFQNPFSHFDTLQRNNNDLYKPGHTDHAAKAKRHETQWPIDKKAAFDADIAFAKKANEIHSHTF